MTKYKIEIDWTGCIGCGACYSTDPSHFDPNQEGESTLIGGETDDNTSWNFRE